MTPGATYYVLGVTLLSVVFPALMVGLWARLSAPPRHVAVKAHTVHRRTHASGSPHSA